MALPVNSSSPCPLSFTCCASIQKCFKRITDVVLNIIQAIGKCLFGRQGSPSPSPEPSMRLAVSQFPTSRALNLIAFYRGRETNNQGMTLSQILNADNDFLEARHNWVQWAFPTTKIGTLPEAPLLDRETVQAFRADPELRANLRQVFLRTLQFYGLQMQPDGQIRRGANFAERTAVWLTPHNHNYLRITRIIQSLGLLLGPPHEEAKAFFNIMQDIYRHEGQGVISENSYQIWSSAHRQLESIG